MQTMTIRDWVYAHSDTISNQCQSHVCVDIGISSVIEECNIFPLIENGWAAYGVEANPRKFGEMQRKLGAKCTLILKTATPYNVNSLIPQGLTDGFLSIDIDGYDYFVLKEIMAHHRPHFVCCEVNVAIPPPFKVALEYFPEHTFESPLCNGVSLSAACELMNDNGYMLIEAARCDVLFSNVGEYEEIDQQTAHERLLKTHRIGEYFRAISKKYKKIPGFVTEHMKPWDGKYVSWQ